MIYVDIACILFGILGIAFAIHFYRELWKWARQCQHARIAIAYKRKVVLQAPVIEWVQWLNLLDKDKASQGRVVYKMGGTTVAITKKVLPPGRLRMALRRRNKTTQPPSRVQEVGTWTGKQETTV